MEKISMRMISKIASFEADEIADLANRANKHENRSQWEDELNKSGHKWDYAYHETNDGSPWVLNKGNSSSPQVVIHGKEGHYVVPAFKSNAHSNGSGYGKEGIYQFGKEQGNGEGHTVNHPAMAVDKGNGQYLVSENNRGHLHRGMTERMAVSTKNPASEEGPAFPFKDTATSQPKPRPEPRQAPQSEPQAEAPKPKAEPHAGAGNVSREAENLSEDIGKKITKGGVLRKALPIAGAAAAGLGVGAALMAHHNKKKMQKISMEKIALPRNPRLERQIRQTVKDIKFGTKKINESRVYGAPYGHDLATVVERRSFLGALKGQRKSAYHANDLSSQIAELIRNKRL